MADTGIPAITWPPAVGSIVWVEAEVVAHSPFEDPPKWVSLKTSDHYYLPITLASDVPLYPSIPVGSVKEIKAA